MLQGLVPNEGDGWQWTLEELARYFRDCAPLHFPENARAELSDPLQAPGQPVSALARKHLGLYLESAATLGRRTAELHVALASRTDDPAFAPEPLTEEDFKSLLAASQARACQTFAVLKQQIPSLPKDSAELAAAVVRRRRHILDPFEVLRLSGERSWRIRIHGDYHLGQVLKVNSDFVILDFEGEPARPLADRRAKQSPLKDVAGMLRSFSYATYMTLLNDTARRPQDLARLQPWAQLWERSVSAEFLRVYEQTAEQNAFLRFEPGDFRKLLNIFLIDKALYEVLYELNARPAWVRIPLLGLLSLVAS
jgi:maltose alpha-D-glucosyltransferase/alpha-amylase